jgi:acetyl esterase/lipase
MKILFWIAILGAGLLMPGASAKADYEVMTRNDILFAEHDGVRLLGDFYAPKGVEKAPVLVAVHGGGWQVGNRKFYTNWGPYLAKNGFAVFAIEYRLMKPDVKAYPGAVYDTKAAVQYIRRFDPDLCQPGGPCVDGRARRATRFRHGGERRESGCDRIAGGGARL